MDASTNSAASRISPASAWTGREGNEVRALATSEIDSVSGASVLHALGGIAIMTYIIVAWGKEIDAALTELEEWIKS